MLARDDVLAVLRDVVDPEIGVSLVDLGLVRDIRITDDRVEIEMELTTPACPLGGYLVEQVRRRVETVAEGRTVEVHLVEGMLEPWPEGMFGPWP